MNGLKKFFPSFEYLNVPNAITLTGIVAGFLGTFFFISGYVRLGLLIYGLTFIGDGLDGMAARRLNQQTEFGVQLDSLADYGNFCIIPAVLV